MENKIEELQLNLPVVWKNVSITDEDYEMDLYENSYTLYELQNVSVGVAIVSEKVNAYLMRWYFNEASSYGNLQIACDPEKLTPIWFSYEELMLIEDDDYMIYDKVLWL